MVEALQAYQEFGAGAANLELVTSVDELSVQARPDVWARGRIAAMLEKASPEQARPIEQHIVRQWEQMKKADDVAEKARNA